MTPLANFVSYDCAVLSVGVFANYKGVSGQFPYNFNLSFLDHVHLHFCDEYLGIILVLMHIYCYHDCIY